MLKQDDYRETAAVKRARQASTSASERVLHFADQLDCLIRRWVIPVDYRNSRLVAATPFFPMVLTAQTLAGSKPLDAAQESFDAEQRIIERDSSGHRAMSQCKVRPCAAHPQPAR